MKLLPYSNGLRQVSMKKHRTPKEISKLILIIVGMLLLVGFVYQKISNFIAKETLRQRVDYTTVDDRRMDFRLKGEGNYTVVFDGVGFVYQKISNFIAKETLRQRVDYTTVDDRRMDFRLKGEGNYTVVFDGGIGGNLEQWTPVVDELSSDNVSTFVYNRRGYGYSDLGPERTPEEQAQDLKILLRKAGAPEPYILVGEGYGSLVLTSFAEQFKDSVAGVMLINPLDESYIGTKDYNKKQIITKLRRNVEKIGSNFGLTELLDALNLDVTLDDFENSLSGDELEEFKTQRTKTKYTTAVYNEMDNLSKGLSNSQKATLDDFENSLSGDELEEFKTQRTKTKYTTAVYNEMDNLSKGLSNSQKAGVFAGMPYYLITNSDSDNLKNLGDESLTKVFKTGNTSSFSGLNSTENVVNGIRYIVKELQSK